MIKTFKDKETKRIFDGHNYKKYVNIQKVIKRKLDMLHFAYSEKDLMAPPSNRFEHLKGDLKDFCSIRINDQFRIIFRFEGGQAYDVEIVDYH